jgi:hypothetical protein
MERKPPSSPQSTGIVRPIGNRRQSFTFEERHVSKYITRACRYIGDRALDSLQEMPFDEQMRVRAAAGPLAKILRIGSSKGSEGRPVY